MSKSIFYKLFGQDKVPPEAMSVIEHEGLIFMEEGLCGSITFKRFRAPGRYYSWKRNGFCGSIVLTEKHLLAFAYSKPTIGVAWEADEARKLKCFVQNGKKLCIEYEAGFFDPDSSGEVTVRYRTELVPRILTKLKKQLRQGRQ